MDNLDFSWSAGAWNKVVKWQFEIVKFGDYLSDFWWDMFLNYFLGKDPIWCLLDYSWPIECSKWGRDVKKV